MHVLLDEHLPHRLRQLLPPQRTWEAKQDLRTALRLAEKAGDARLKSDIEEMLEIIR